MTQKQETTVNAQVGELVHQHMWRNKVTQTALAGVLGIGQPGVARKLRGERPFTIDELLAVAAYLNLPITELVPNAENPRPEGPDGGETVRHQGLEPRTRWYGAIPRSHDAEIIPLRPGRDTAGEVIAA